MARRRSARPWRDSTYTRVTDRRRHLERCPRAYLDPDADKPRYQVAPKGSCSPTCRGLRAAFRRAILNRERSIAAEAERLGLRMGCPGFGKKLGRG